MPVESPHLPASPAIGDGKRLTVGITTSLTHGNFERLLPGRRLEWKNCRFLLNPPRGAALDFWIVFSDSRNRDMMRCAPENTLFLAGEPPSKKVYPRAFYAQFHQVVSTHQADPHPRVTAAPLGLNWHVGLQRGSNQYAYGHDELSSLEFPSKENRVSVVCSDLTTTQGQRDRLAFLGRLKELLGDRLVHFGRGFNPVTDKMDAILPYRFHLVLENCCSPHYWTEKLSDAYLGWAHPFYVGCPNLEESFPREAFTPMSVADPEAAAEKIQAALASPPDERERAAIAAARDRILNEFNPFARYAHWAECFHVDAPASNVNITSHRAFRPFPRNWLFRLKTLRG